ncbi:MAG: hypothetical protein BWZ00_01357 [Bacteroidetes bacterium ADurb.BinA174]|nr:MAG: hypothetical protein BWZ00_01357 [Bacteroidetes bacterium ADurb.BinA174]
MPYINTEWLINGSGQMYKDGFDIDSIPKEHDLFNQSPTITSKEKEPAIKPEEIEINKPEKGSQIADSKIIDVQKNYDKKITQIIIYYNDNTFETFMPHSVK